jgi:hypothetical protein
MQASTQWATRPDDQRFTSLPAMLASQQAMTDASKEKVIKLTGLRAVPADNDASHKTLLLNGPNGVPVGMTHWSFGQLASQAGAPASYLRSLPAPMAADCINYGLHMTGADDTEECKVLLTRGDSGNVLRALTSPTYGRVTNASVISALIGRFGDGVTGAFRVPGIQGRALEQVTKANTTLYASDRDMFVFLADEENRIELPGRRDGKTGTMARGFFVTNSEVGAGKIGVCTFLFDYVCANRIVWGAKNFKEISVRHNSGAPERFMREIAPAIREYAQGTASSVVAQITDARSKKVGDLDAFLKARFTKGEADGIKAAHLADEGRPMETLWDVTTGVTAYARGISYANERVAMERKGGQILEMAA